MGGLVLRALLLKLPIEIVKTMFKKSQLKSFMYKKNVCRSYKYQWTFFFLSIAEIYFKFQWQLFFKQVVFLKFFLLSKSLI